MLTSQPHSFSRVFTGGFFEALANMTALQSPTPTERDLLKTSQDAGKLLVEALQMAPASSDFYSQVAAHMIEADKLHFHGKYSVMITSAFIRRGILSLEATAMISSQLSSSTLAARKEATPEYKTPLELPQVTLPATNYGLRSKTLVVSVPEDTKRLPAATATARLGIMASPSVEKMAKSFVDDLFKRGKIDVGRFADVNAGIAHPTIKRKTHKLVQTPKGLMLTRVLFR
jgi:hypothetical protein